MSDDHQGHLDRLTSVDAGFLHMEEDGAHMHIGALGVFAGPPPSVEAFRAHIDARLPRLPRYRQRVQEMPLGTGRPVWVEDAHFRLGLNVRHADHCCLMDCELMPPGIRALDTVLQTYYEQHHELPTPDCFGASDESFRQSLRPLLQNCLEGVREPKATP